MGKSQVSLLARISCATVVSLAFMQAPQANAFSYPTKWVLENQTDAPVFLSCDGDSGSARVALRELRSERIPARGRTLFTWPGYYANDGLGLNAARWQCRDLASGTVLESFSTDWGEDVRLVLVRMGDRVSLIKN